MSSINVALAPSFLGAFWTKDRHQGLGPLMGIFVYGGRILLSSSAHFLGFSSIPVLFSFAPQMRVEDPPLDQLYRIICFLNCFCPIIHFHPTSCCTASFLGSANCALRLGGVIPKFCCSTTTNSTVNDLAQAYGLAEKYEHADHEHFGP